MVSIAVRCDERNPNKRRLRAHQREGKRVRRCLVPGEARAYR